MSALDYLSTVTLGAGAHTPGGLVCAMEALSCAMGLPHSDAPACTDAPLATAFRAVNDWYGWRNDEARTAFLRPYIMRLGRLALDGRHAPASAYAYAAADVACRLIAPMALDAAGLSDLAATLRGLSPVVDRATARAAAEAAYAATYATAAGKAVEAAYADAAAYAAARAAAAAAYAAADAAAAAAYAADAAAAARAAAGKAVEATRAATAADAAQAAAADAAQAAAPDAARAAANADADADAAAAYAAAYAAAAGALLTRLLDVCEAGCWPLPVGVTS